MIDFLLDDVSIDIIISVFSLFIITMKRKKSAVFTISSFMAVVAADIVYHLILIKFSIHGFYEYVCLLLYLLPLFLLFKENIFQKIFAFSFFLVFVISIHIFVISLILSITQFEEIWYGAERLIFPALILAAVVIAVWRFGRRFFERLFTYGSKKEWILYSINAWICFLILFLVNFYFRVNILLLYFVIFFSLWSMVILCLAIINTHEKAKQKYEADLLREIITSGKDYYAKLSNITDRLKVMQHDYKHHLVTMQKLFEDGYKDEARAYLEKLNANMPEEPLHNYCENKTLNSLLSSFAERCEKEHITFSAKIILPPPDTVDDYEMCIVVGNLLENAVTACFGTPEGKERYVKLSMNPQNGNFGFMVSNSFNGVLELEGENLKSTKKDGGLGIHSIKSVIKRHNGEYFPSWNDSQFKAFVVLKLEK